MRLQPYVLLTLYYYTRRLRDGRPRPSWAAAALPAAGLTTPPARARLAAAAASTAAAAVVMAPMPLSARALAAARAVLLVLPQDLESLLDARDLRRHGGARSSPPLPRRATLGRHPGRLRHGRASPHRWQRPGSLAGSRRRWRGRGRGHRQWCPPFLVLRIEHRVRRVHEELGG